MVAFIVAAMKPDDKASISSRFAGYDRTLLQQGRREQIGAFAFLDRTPRDSSAPHSGGSEENGIGICESSSQRGNYREIIRLARRNHKPGGADLAGSVHVVRSLSG